MINKLFCMRLSTAGYVIGGMNIAISSTVIFFNVIALANIDEVARTIEKYIHEKVKRSDLAYALKLYLAGSVISIVLASMLIMGIRKKRPGLMLPWMAITGLAIVLNICYCLGLLINVLLDGAGFLPTAISFLYLGITIYIYIGMYTLYHQICRGNSNPRIESSDQNNPETAAGLYSI
ncbi:uncharacterized protein LOC111519024 [Drosophila willistoni]|uniref:uncharacterized protein LOC111519024 n=1 Tax=Drosophila willistoni TaxID=7260 RepID=UPI000C26D849|nr:uncharacterized protein LOC111519024 [Drosophila willistoni]